MFVGLFRWFLRECTLFFLVTQFRGGGNQEMHHALDGQPSASSLLRNGKTEGVEVGVRVAPR